MSDAATLILESLDRVAEITDDPSAQVYERLFTEQKPDGMRDAAGNDIDFKTFINPDSLKVITAWAEPALAKAQPEDRWQFERVGYFCADRKDHNAATPVFNRTVGLRDSWAK